MRTAGAKAALIVAAEEDEDFAQRVVKAARGFEIAIGIDDSLPPREHRFVLLVWSAARPVSAADVPMLIELWSQGKLLIVRRDRTALPLGLGDLETVPADASAQDTADNLWRRATGTAARMPPARRGGNSWMLGGGLAAVLLLGAGFWLDIQSRLSSDDRAGNAAAPAAPSADEMPWMWIGAALVALALLLTMRRRAAPAARPETRPEATTGPRQGAAAAPAGALFISCAAVDRGRIDPLLAEIEGLGHAVWIDRTDLADVPGGAGQIARAIEGSKAVVLMASPGAYASDQVARELHLALHSKKTIVPIELEPAEPPPELAPLLAPFPRHALPPGDRKLMLRHALDAA